ncbi:MAG: type secretion system protein VirB2 [Sphingomonadales bacterium]|nr:type secretion system protein VirB2 [Sphingomonadales bacterium]
MRGPAERAGTGTFPFFVGISGPLAHYPPYESILGETMGKMRGTRLGPYAAAFAMALQSAAAMAQDTYSDPAGSGVIVSAVRWLEGTLLGTIATVVAVIAVASVGFLMLTGRINWRYGATVILGCFILFGAASIVAGIQSTASLGQ